MNGFIVLSLPKGLIPDVSVIPTPNEDPLGIGLDYCEVEEGEIDEVVEARPQIEADSEANGIFSLILFLLVRTLYYFGIISSDELAERYSFVFSKTIRDARCYHWEFS